jgi:hypothetical protein
VAGIAQHELTAIQVDVPNVVEVSCYSGELAGAAGEVDRVGDYCVDVVVALSSNLWETIWRKRKLQC